MKKIFFLLFFFGIVHAASAFTVVTETPSDSIIILLGKKTRIAIQAQSKADMEDLKKYDLNALLREVLEIREKSANAQGKDTTFVLNNDTIVVKQNQVTIKDKEKDGTTFTIKIGGKDGDIVIHSDDEDINCDDNKNKDSNKEPETRKFKRTHSEWYFDLGLNNYLTDAGNFVDQNTPYSLKPLGSRYIAFSKIYKTRIGGAKSPLGIHYGLEASFYNFMFDSNSRIMKGASGVEFSEIKNDQGEVRGLSKNKLTAIYGSIPVMLMLDMGQVRTYTDKGKNAKSSSHSDFRLGLGGFFGYRLHSYSKVKFEADGNKDHDRSGYYLNNIRYGLQAQIGIRSVDLFFKYDLNPLFTDNKGPQDLRAIAFGFRF